MENLQELIELGKDITVLYVEDDERLQQETKKMLSRIFKEVRVAGDGQEGEMLYTKNPTDLVITDIEMPVMNGLKMSRGIKRKNPEAPIVVVSAYTDVEYFLEAIENGINYYVLKPVNTQQFLQTLFLACKHIQDRRIAKAYRSAQIKNRIETEKQRLLSEISNSSPNPMVVYSDGRLKFYNQAFQECFMENGENVLIDDENGLANYLNANIVTDEIFKERNDIMATFHTDYLENEDKKIAVKTLQGKKIFLIIKSPFDVDSETQAVMYTFNDITELMYQQVQLAMYDKRIDSLVEDKFLTKTPKNEGIINRVDFDI